MPDRAPLRIVRDEARAAPRRSGKRVSVAGAAKYQRELIQLAGGKQRESQYIATNAELWREPDNPHDRNAVQVLIAGRVVGYLPRAEAERLASMMDGAGMAAIACQAEIRGGWRDGRDEGNFGVVVWIPAETG
jgi:hypothetical protein